MQPLCVHALVLALMMAFSEASWRPHARPQDGPSGPGANRDLEPQWRKTLGLTSHHLQGPPRPVADLSKKQVPWQEEEEEAAYGWMDFGRRSAEDADQHP